MANTPGPSKTIHKRSRSAINLETKLKIIKDKEKGKTITSIARDFGFSHSTISTILLKKDEIRAAVKESTSVNATIISQKRKGPIIEMEKLLIIWMDDLIQKRMPLSLALIKAKALSLFDDIKKGNSEYAENSFFASNGWFQNFKRRSKYHNVKIGGEMASADDKAAKIFIESFDQIQGDYLPEQIFNADETSLYWKRMPQRSYVNTEAHTVPGFKVSKERVTLLLGGNVAGYKLKPLLIHNSKNPRAMKGVNKHMLPLHYFSNSKAWMTRVIFEEWFRKHFIPEAKAYCDQKKVPFKILLLLDNAPSHPPGITELDDNVKVVYMPPNTTSIIQPMDQGAISTMKAYYLRKTLSNAVAAIDKDESLTLIQFWKNYNVYSAIKNIGEAWSEVSEKCMNGVWRNLLNRYVGDSSSTDETLGEVHSGIIEIAHHLNVEIRNEDILEVIDAVAEDLTNDELLEIQEGIVENWSEDDCDVDILSTTKEFNTKEMKTAFKNIDDALNILESMDPDAVRFAKIKRSVNDSLVPYQEILKENQSRKVQTQINNYFKTAN